MNEIKLFNTLGREMQLFVPLVENKVGIYTCGPTVYGRAHIGNLKTYVFADTLRRMFEYANYDVKHVMNITDVGHLTSDADEGEDKLQKAAKESKTSAWEISKKWTKQFFKDIEKLNIKIPSIICKATDYIEEQINLIKKLEENGFTYKTSDGIYFDTSKFSKYGDFAKIKLEGLQAGKRIGLGEKKNKTDFALWKFSPEDEKRDMEWNSPWGIGFPGWHIECSAMSMKHLGEHFDIHTGGVDHIPIHHTNEIAQAECATGKKFVNYWMHSEFLIMSEKKMGKSFGNVLNLDKIEEMGVSPLSYRYFCLNTHYRKKLNFNQEALLSAKTAYENLSKKYNIYKRNSVELSELSKNAKKYLEEFKESIFNDLNTPKCLGIVWNLIKDKDMLDSEKYFLLKDFDRVFGLNLDKQKNNDNNIEQEIIDIAEKRLRARKEKNYNESDELRKKIISLGYNIKDTDEGYELELIYKS